MATSLYVAPPEGFKHARATVVHRIAIEGRVEELAAARRARSA